MGVLFRLEYLPARFEAAHAHASHGKARALLGYRDTVRLEDGVSAMAAWAKQVGARDIQSFGRLEIERNLPPSWRDPEAGGLTRGRS